MADRWVISVDSTCTVLIILPCLEILASMTLCEFHIVNTSYLNLSWINLIPLHLNQFGSLHCTVHSVHTHTSTPVTDVGQPSCSLNFNGWKIFPEDNSSSSPLKATLLATSATPASSQPLCATHLDFAPQKLHKVGPRHALQPPLFACQASRLENAFNCLILSIWERNSHIISELLQHAHGHWDKLVAHRLDCLGQQSGLVGGIAVKWSGLNAVSNKIENALRKRHKKKTLVRCLLISGLLCQNDHWQSDTLSHIESKLSTHSN